MVGEAVGRRLLILIALLVFVGTACKCQPLNHHHHCQIDVLGNLEVRCVGYDRGHKGSMSVVISLCTFQPPHHCCDSAFS